MNITNHDFTVKPEETLTYGCKFIQDLWIYLWILFGLYLHIDLKKPPELSNKSWSCRWGTRNHKNFSWMSVDYFLNTVVSCVLSDVVMLPQLTLSWLFLAPDLKSSCKACCVQALGACRGMQQYDFLYGVLPVKAIHIHAARCALVWSFQHGDISNSPVFPPLVNALCPCRKKNILVFRKVPVNAAVISVRGDQPFFRKTASRL